MAKPRSWEREPVDSDELRDFRDKVQKMADEQFRVDDEGDPTVEVILVDRTAGRLPQYSQVPYKGGFKEAIYNLRLAFHDFDIEMSKMSYRLDTEKKP